MPRNAHSPTSSLRLWFTSVAGVATFALSTPPAKADAFDDATQLYKAKKYEEAARKAERAMVDDPNPRLQYAACMGWFASGRMSAAWYQCDEFLKRTEADRGPETGRQRAKAEGNRTQAANNTVETVVEATAVSAAASVELTVWAPNLAEQFIIRRLRPNRAGVVARKVRLEPGTWQATAQAERHTFPKVELRIDFEGGPYKITVPGHAEEVAVVVVTPPPNLDRPPGPATAPPVEQMEVAANDPPLADPASASHREAAEPKPFFSRPEVYVGFGTLALGGGLAVWGGIKGKSAKDKEDDPKYFVSCNRAKRVTDPNVPFDSAECESYVSHINSTYPSLIRLETSAQFLIGSGAGLLGGSAVDLLAPSDTTRWVTLGTGAALAIAGAVVWYPNYASAQDEVGIKTATVRKEAELVDGPDGKPLLQAATIGPDPQTVGRDRLIAGVGMVLVGTGIGLATASAINLLRSPDDAPDAANRVRVSTIVGPGQAGLDVTLRF